MTNSLHKHLVLVPILLLLFLPNSVYASQTNGTIDPTFKYAWSNNAGWINFAATTGNVHVTDGGITGYAWSSNYGWINLSPSNGGVTNDGEGVLGGFAWGASLGWIDFSGVTIDSTGQFHGTATGSVIGTLTFDCTNCAVITDWRPISIRPTLTLFKTVVNNNGGAAIPANFQLLIFDPSANSFSQVSSGAVRSISAGSYTVSEIGDPAHYTASTWSGDCSANGTITLILGQVATCTITNNDIPASLHVITQVVNTSGGTATASTFTVHVKNAGVDVSGSPLAGVATPGTLYSLSTGIHTVSEDPNASYTQSFSGDCDSGGSVTLSLGDDKTCTIVNTDIPAPPPPPLLPNTGGGGGSGGGVIVGLLPLGSLLGALPNTCTYPSTNTNPDITGDGTVDIFDFNLLLVAWGTGGAQSADITHDCSVDIFDFNALMVGWSS